MNLFPGKKGRKGEKEEGRKGGRKEEEEGKYK